MSLSTTILVALHMLGLLFLTTWFLSVQHIEGLIATKDELDLAWKTALVHAHRIAIGARFGLKNALSSARTRMPQLSHQSDLLVRPVKAAREPIEDPEKGASSGSGRNHACEAMKQISDYDSSQTMQRNTEPLRVLEPDVLMSPTTGIEHAAANAPRDPQPGEPGLRASDDHLAGGG